MRKKWHYDTIYVLDLFKKFYSEKLKSIDEVVLADIGCADGQKIKPYREFCSRIVGLDKSMEDLKKAQKTGIDVINGDAQILPFPDDSFEVVTSIHVIEHLEEDLKHLREMYRILKPAGALVMLTPNSERLTSKLFRRPLPKEHLR